MQDKNRTLTDKQVELFIGGLLRGGVIAAAAVVATGGALFFFKEMGAIPHFARFVAEPKTLSTVPGILHSALSLDSRAVIQLGLLMLIAVPIARVAASIGAFALQRDWLYCAVTTAVLSLLLFSLFTSN
jgi:uncharacterized membrane protein